MVRGTPRRALILGCVKSMRAHAGFTSRTRQQGLVFDLDHGPVDAVREVIVRVVPIVGEGWRRPPPTTAELAGEWDRQRILAQGREQ